MSKDKITDIQFTRELDDTGNGAEVNPSDMGLFNVTNSEVAINPSPFEKTASANFQPHYNIRVQ